MLNTKALLLCAMFGENEMYVPKPGSTVPAKIILHANTITFNEPTFIVYFSGRAIATFKYPSGDSFTFENTMDPPDITPAGLFIPKGTTMTQQNGYAWGFPVVPASSVGGE